MPHQDDLLRQALVDGQLKPSKITCPKVLKAFTAVSRLPFGRDPHITTSVYRDTVIPLLPGRTWLPPLVMAHMLQLADIKSHESVCVLASSLGYMGGLVHTYVRNVHVQDLPEHLYDDKGETPLEHQHITMHAVSPQEGPAVSVDVVLVDGGEVEAWPDTPWPTKRTIGVYRNRIVCRETGETAPLDVWLVSLDARLPEFRTHVEKDWLAATSFHKANA